MNFLEDADQVVTVGGLLDDEMALRLIVAKAHFPLVIIGLPVV